MHSRNHEHMYDFSVLRDLRKRNNLTISQVCEKSGVSPAVISKLERNQTLAELETLHRLGRVFGITASELLSLAESRTAQRKSVESYQSGGFQFKRIAFSNVRCLIGKGKKGQVTSRPEVHGDDYEVCWVLEGTVKVSLPNEHYELSAGDAVQFDAVLEHEYEVMKDCRILVVHVAKGKRF